MSQQLAVVEAVTRNNSWRNKMFKGIKKAINKFISKLAQESEKSFGNEKLDCCTLDRPKSKNK